MKHLLLFFVFIIGIVSGQTKNPLLIYSTPGSYVLNPSDYGNSPFIMVEIWGAGASGCACLGNGGGSGAYINALVSTNNLSFNLTVGTGGNATYAAIGCNFSTGNSGTDSSFISIENNSSAYLIAGGGSSCEEWGEYSDYGGAVKSQVCEFVYESTNGAKGSGAGIKEWNTNIDQYFGGIGGSAQNGGLGGKGSIQYGYKNLPPDPYRPTLPTAGLTPGGGGGGFNVYDYMNLNPFKNLISGYSGKGGNGAIIIHVTYDAIIPITTIPTNATTHISLNYYKRMLDISKATLVISVIALVVPLVILVGCVYIYKKDRSRREHKNEYIEVENI